MTSSANEVLISAVEGNTQWLDGGAMFGNVPRSMWENWVTVDDQNRIQLHCRAMLIEHAGKRLLCETGIGAFFEPKLAQRFGVRETEHCLVQNLNQMGLGEDDIDYVILSHLHFDHAGGLLPTYDEIKAGKDRLLFPRAQYLVGKEAWQRAQKPHPRDRASFIPGLSDKLAASGRLVIVEGEEAPGIFPGRLAFLFSHGHTPGQMHTIFKGNKQAVFFAGDLIPGTPWVHTPITMGYDRFPELLIDEKNAVYQKAVPEKWLIFYTHDTKYAASFVQVDDKGKYSAAQPLADMRQLAI
jgi:glyoxylase-like metal-dependent hydrolase (beta-lactamase superfamily II)